MIKEQEIQLFMKNLDLTREQALELYEFDHSKQTNEEVQQMEEKAKELKRRYEGNTKNRPKATKEKKVDNNKRFIMGLLLEIVQSNKDFLNIEVLNPEKEITFDYLDNNYSVVLTRHKKK